MRCRIEMGMTRNSRKRTKFYTQIQTEKRFFVFRDRERGKTIFYSHRTFTRACAARKNDKQNKTLSLSLCVCWSNWNKSRPVIFNFSVSPIFFCVCSSADDGTENENKKTLQRTQQSHRELYINMYIYYYIHTRSHQEFQEEEDEEYIIYIY